MNSETREMPRFLRRPDLPVPDLRPRDLDAPQQPGPVRVADAPLSEEAAALVGEAGLTRNFLEELARVVGEMPRVPPIGTDAAKKMERCFDIAATDVRRIGNEGVERAELIRQECETYATVLLDAGRVLSGKIQAEAARCYKTSEILRQLSRLIEVTPAPPA